MEFIGLRFLLKGGTFLGAVVEKQHALSIVKNWMAGKLPEYIGDTDSKIMAWSVRVSDIAGVHTFDAQPQQQAFAPMTNPMYAGMSGIK